jgi:ABC-type lipoprotein release transport system permease subunit
MSLSTTKLWRDINKNLEHLLGLSNRVYFWVFTLSVRVKHFQVDLDGMENDCAYS